MKIEKTGQRITVTADGDFDLSICPELKALLEEDLSRDHITHAEQTKIETAKNLLKYGDSIEKISMIIGLPLEKVQQLQAEIKE